MTNKRTTKRSLVLSFMALLLCAAMFVGTTYAWFTDSVTSGNNIIKSGNLDVEMYWLEGNEDPTATDGWEDASKGAIFNNTNWEPGRTEAKHIKIANVGSLAFNYQMRIVANGTVSKLADVIDVYYFAGGKQLTRDDATTGTYLGTLAEVMGTDKNLVKTVAGMLEAGKDVTTTLALKMRESAGNEYQNLSIGTDFSIELIATQASFEDDSFGNNYDAAAPAPEVPAALVRPLEDRTADTSGSKLGADLGAVELDVAYQFEPTMSYNDALNSAYRYWHADFVVSADRDVPANSMALAGYYDAWCSLNNDKWVALTADQLIAANDEIRLVANMASGFSVNWEELCLYGNDGIGFRCGAVDLTGVNAGTTLTVELRIYETEEPSAANGNSHNVETGEYITIGVFTYTFPYPAEEITSVANDAELAAALANGKTNLSLANGTYHMPAAAKGKVFTVSSASGNADDVIFEVVPGGQGEAGGQLDYNLDGSNVCFNKVTVKTNSQLYAGYARLEATYNECVIQNTFNLATGKAVFNNCEINITNEYLRVGGASKAEFIGCTFNTDGRAILVFQDGTQVAQTVLVKDCTFNATAPANTWNGIHVAAVSYDGSQGGTYTVTFEGNNVVDSDFNGLWQVKAGAENVTVNGLN